MKLIYILIGFASILAYAFISPMITGNFFAPERISTRDAIVESGLFNRLADAGVKRVERSSRHERLIVEMKDDSTIEDSSVCAWNETVERQGYCDRLTPGSGRGYILDVDKSRFHGDELPPTWSKERFMTELSNDAEKALIIADSWQKKKAQEAQAAKSWTAAAKVGEGSK